MYNQKLTIDEEVAEVNKLLLQLIDTERLTKWVEVEVGEIIANNINQYVGRDRELLVDEETLIDQGIESYFEKEYGTDKVPTVFYEEVHEKFNGWVFENFKGMAEEIYSEQEEFEQDPLGFHGMSQADFI